MQQTSIWAYQSVKGEQINKRQKEVLDALREIQPASNRMVAEHSRIPINVVTPRMGELVKKGRVAKAFVRFDRYGRKAIFWKAKDEDA